MSNHRGSNPWEKTSDLKIKNIIHVSQNVFQWLLLLEVKLNCKKVGNGYEERLLSCFKWLVAQKWINQLYFAMYILYELYHGSYITSWQIARSMPIGRAWPCKTFEMPYHEHQHTRIFQCLHIHFHNLFPFEKLSH